jgi:iron complex transport system permease protein
VRRAAALAGFAALLGVLVVASFTLGTRQIDLGTTLAALLGQTSGTDAMVVIDLRGPRTAIGLIAGAALGVAGALMQGITRNPLADPGILGVNAGASLMVVVAISVLGISSAAGYVWFAFAGAAAAAVLVYLVGSGRQGATPLSLTLAGAAVTAMLTSISTLVLLTDLETLSQFRFWQVGSLTGRDLGSVAVVAPFIVGGVALALLLGPRLNGLALGDDAATGLGQSVRRTRVLAAIAIVVLCGGATSIAGPIVFVGLVVPHVARWVVGPDHRWILAYSLVLGPILLLAADIVGRLIVQPAELEAGLLVAAIGAPVLIALVRRSRVSAL